MPEEKKVEEKIFDESFLENEKEKEEEKTELIVEEEKKETEEKKEEKVEGLEEEKKKEIVEEKKVEIEKEIEKEPPKFKTDIYTIPDEEMFKLSVADEASERINFCNNRLKQIDKQIGILQAKEEENSLKKIDEIEFAKLLNEKDYIEQTQIPACTNVINVRKSVERVVDEIPSLLNQKKLIFTLFMKRKLEPNMNPEYVEWYVNNKCIKKEDRKIEEKELKKEAKKESVQESMQDVLSKKIDNAKKNNLTTTTSKKTIPEEEKENVDLSKLSPRMKEVFDIYKESNPRLSDKEIFDVMKKKRS